MAATYLGEYRDGVVVFPDGLPAIPQGARVRIEQVDPAAEPMQTIGERYAEIVGIADDLPEDFAAEHDHYIHGTPRRNGT